MIQRDWLVIDATDVVLGRLASHAATLLRGKHKPTFAPHMDIGDFVIIINAEKVALTGPSSSRRRPTATRVTRAASVVTYAELLEKNPVRAVEKADPRHAPEELASAAQQLGSSRSTRGAEHPHAAQQPKTLHFAQVAQ